MEHHRIGKGEGVSESIGYLIIFGLVLTGIGLITLYGYPLLMQQQSSANMRNMEQTMIVLQNDIKSLTYKLSNYKETSMRVSGGSLSLYGPQYSIQNFTVEDAWGNLIFKPPHLGELRYFSDADSTVIALENGAVIEKPVGQKGSFMLADPRWYMDTSSGERTLVITFMNLSSMESAGQLLSQTGVGTVRMRLARSNMTTVEWDNTPIRVRYSPANTATITPDGYAYAWKTYLTNPSIFPGVTWMGTGLPGADDIYDFPNMKRVVIKEYDIVVETL